MTEVTTTGLLEETYDHLKRRGTTEATIERVVAGEHLLMAEFSSADGETLAGVVHSPSDSYPDVDGLSIQAVIERALEDKADPEDRALGIAGLNALSAPFLDWQEGDPMDALDPAVETIGMVGMFSPAFGKFDGLDIRVVERFPADVSPPADLPPGVSVSVHGPEAAADAFADVAVVYVTGSTMIYGGIETYLAATPPDATFVLIGSTASFLPDAVFEAGVDVLAGAEVVDPALVGDRIAGETTVPELHGTGLKKGVLINEDARPLNGMSPAFGAVRTE